MPGVRRKERSLGFVLFYNVARLGPLEFRRSPDAGELMALFTKQRDWWRGSRVGTFWHRVTEGLTLQELWKQFHQEAGASYRLYTHDLDQELSEVPRGRRPLATARALMWSLLSKLSPSRRLLLLLALLLLVLGGSSWGIHGRVVGVLIVLALLALELADRVAMKRDLEIAREIQHWLVPHEPPVIPGVDLAFATRPANTVAGDYYDAFLRRLPVTPGESPPLLIVVADVAGKSMPAALLMATFQSSLHTVVQEPVPLPDVVNRLNRYACEHSLEGRRFTTAVLAELDLARGTMIYVNAGHNPPLLRRANGDMVRLDAGGLPLGIQEEARHESGSLTLSPGDVLVIYTDGVVDAESTVRGEYGDARLTDLVRSTGSVPAKEMLERILASVTVFSEGTPRQDDITCLVMRYTGI